MQGPGSKVQCIRAVKMVGSGVTTAGCHGDHSPCDVTSVEVGLGSPADVRVGLVTDVPGVEALCLFTAVHSREIEAIKSPVGCLQQGRKGAGEAGETIGINAGHPRASSALSVTWCQLSPGARPTRAGRRGQGAGILSRSELQEKETINRRTTWGGGGSRGMAGEQER